jgi:pyridoxine kinase
MAKILAISSQVVFGPVGLNAIVPALQAEGHDVLALPTVLLSNHPGHGRPAGGAIDIAPMIETLENLGAFKDVDAVITGYFASAEQISRVARLIAKLKPAIVLVDPVMGDHGRLYVSEDVAMAIRDLLIPLASILTPNAFELSWLTGLVVVNEREAQIAARALGVAVTVATSITDGPALLATIEFVGGDICKMSNAHMQSVPNGTGDFLAGLYLARQFGSTAKTALRDSLEILHRAISLSGETKVLSVAAALKVPPPPFGHLPQQSGGSA